MNLQPSNSIYYNDRRELFGWELETGGHGQVALTGAGTFTPTSSAYAFYQIDFLAATTVTSVSFKTTNSLGQTIYVANSADFAGLAFPALYEWKAPVNSITIIGGKGIAYQYLIQNEFYNKETFDF